MQKVPFRFVEQPVSIAPAVHNVEQAVKP